MRHSFAVVAIPFLVLGLNGCSSAAPAAEDGVLEVVASTNAWGSVAEAVGGERVRVTSIIDSPGQDPHEYEASARDQLAVSRADLVIENGGGYDPFLGTLLEASGARPPVIDAVEASGLLPSEDAHADDHSGEHSEHVEGFNEHVWYDLPTARAVARSVAGELAALDPQGKDDYAAGLAAFDRGIATLEASMAGLRERLDGDTVLATESVPLRLLTQLGLTDVTPPDLAEAVEEDSDVAPGILQKVLELVGSGEVSLLAYNAQAATGQTERIRDSATAADVPVVAFSETLPNGVDYLEWMSANVRHVAEALT